MKTEQDKKIKNDKNETVEVENDSSSDKKPTFRYLRQKDDDARQKSSSKKIMAFLKTWFWLLTSILLLITILILFINYFGPKGDKGELGQDGSQGDPGVAVTGDDKNLIKRR